MEFVTRQFLHDNHLLMDGYIAYTTLGELTDEQLYEAELEENVQREDLTWQERVAAIAALHKFRLIQTPPIQSKPPLKKSSAKGYLVESNKKFKRPSISHRSLTTYSSNTRPMKRPPARQSRMNSRTENASQE